MAEYNDPTHVPEIDKEITEGQKDAISVKLAGWIRTKMYGIDVREAIARFVLWMSVLYNRLLAISNKLINRQDQLEKDMEKIAQEFDEVTVNATEDLEVIRARSSNHTNITFKTLGKRLDAMEKSHYTLPARQVSVLVNLEDDRFSVNHEILKIATVPNPTEFSALVIAEIGSVDQDTFYIKKVGEIDV